MRSKLFADLPSEVQKTLSQAHLKKDVVAEGINQDEEDWWYVPVISPQGSEEKIKFYQILAEIENKVREKFGINLLLIPAAKGDLRPLPKGRK